MDEPLPDPMFTLTQLLELAAVARNSARDAGITQHRAVEFGRRHGSSWQDLSDLLDVPAETLRRRYRSVGWGA